MPESSIDIVRGGEGKTQRLVLYDKTNERFVHLAGSILFDSDEVELLTLSNPGRVDLGDVLEQILLELQRMNEHLALLTDTVIEPGEQLGG